MFSAWGHVVYRRRWLVLLFSGALLVLSAVALAQGGKLTGQSAVSATESGRAAALVRDEIAPVTTRGGGSSLIIVFSGRGGLHVGDARFRDAMLSALTALRQDSRVSSIRTPYDVLP